MEVILTKGSRPGFIEIVPILYTIEKACKNMIEMQLGDVME